jgi:hypothetical protein
MLRTLTVAIVGTGAVSEPSVLLFGGFQTLLAPQPVDPLEVHKPAVFTKQNRDPAINISWVLNECYQHMTDRRLFFVNESSRAGLQAARK